MGRSHVQNGQISEQIDGVNGIAVFLPNWVIEGAFPNEVVFGGNVDDDVGVSSSGEQLHRLLHFFQLVRRSDDTEGERPWPSLEKNRQVIETIDARCE